MSSAPSSSTAIKIVSGKSATRPFSDSTDKIPPFKHEIDDDPFNTYSNRQTQQQACCDYIFTRLLLGARQHKITLEATKPEIALIMPAEDEEDWKPPESLVISASANVRFHGASGRLLVMQLSPSNPVSESKPWSQLAEIKKSLDAWRGNTDSYEGKTLAGTVPWCLHEPKVTRAMLALEAETLAVNPNRQGILKRILCILRILNPDENGPVITQYREQYGPDVAFSVAYSYFYVQMLWCLAVICLPAALLGFGADKDGGGHLDIPFLLLKVVVVVWGIAVAAVGASRFQAHDAALELFRKAHPTLMRRMSTISTTRRKRQLWKLWGLAVPSLVLLISVSMISMLMVTTLILHIIFVWGDCYNLHTEDNPCRDAEQKHGIWGWAAEVGADVGLALLFELFFALGRIISKWISHLISFEYCSDKQLFEEMLEVYIAAIERIGFVSCLAFVFVPQWSEPSTAELDIDLTISCDDLHLGESDYRCYQKRLKVGLRRWVLFNLMKGPFMVAPFISILVKIIIPAFLQYSTYVCDSCPITCLICWPLRFVFRVCSLIFALDGDNVGCLKFPCSQPFTEAETQLKAGDADMVQEFSVHSSLESYSDGVQIILEQGTRKVFYAEDELMELEMNFLWVLFFTPLRPAGVVTMLVARIIELQTDLLKLFYIRRKPFPTRAKVLRREQTAFANAVLLASCGWMMGLCLITYNDDLYKWNWWGYVILACLFLWMVGCALLGFKMKARFGFASFYAAYIHPILYGNKPVSNCEELPRNFVLPRNFLKGEPNGPIN